MKSFLKGAAEQVFGQNDLRKLKDICVVLPSRRASFFFKNELSQLSEVPFISPTVFSIDDFVCKMSGLQIADQVSLIFDLFEDYAQLDENLKFEEFISWAPTVLKDFDLIDQYLVSDVKALFQYMSEVEALKRWVPDSSKPIIPTDHSKSYFKLYDNLGKVYFQFRKDLVNENKAYRGMAYRLLAEDLEHIVLEDLEYSHFYFIGLNALSRAEEQIVGKLVNAKKATCLWDADSWFMGSTHQAGDVLRRYKKTNLFGVWNESENYLSTSSKEITIYDTPFNSLQSKVGAELLTEENTVFVVPDENLIQPLLFSLGKDVYAYNITMGLGLSQSKLLSLVKTLFDLQSIGSFSSNSGHKYNHAYIQKILTDPLIKLYERAKYPLDRPFEKQRQKIIGNNQVFLSEREMMEFRKEEPLIKYLFQAWRENPSNSIASIKSILGLLQETIFEELDSMEKEFFMLFYSVLNRLECEIGKKTLSVLSVKLLLDELVKLERVPFTGEPIAPLQVMSLLETRCLDFDHVVLFSFNEGVIPSSKKNTSLIPYEACKEYGIPVFSDQDSIMAYHFYRLIMRAKKVDIIYSNAKSKGIGGASEGSRFILQLINLLAADNPNIRLKEKNVDFKPQGKVLDDYHIQVEKDGQLIRRIKEYLDQKGLSASSISQYYQCSLQFYFSKILGLKEEDEIEEIFGANVFGNWIHRSIEIISKEIIQLNQIASNDLKENVLETILGVLNRVFKEHFGGYQIDSGINLIYRKMAEKFLKSYYEECFFDGRPKVIIAAEEKFSTDLDLSINGEAIPVKIHGTIDSVELHQNELVLVDFKTGSVNSGELNISTKTNFTDTFVNPNKTKFRQLAIYKYLIYNQIKDFGKINGYDVPSNTKLVSGMYSFRDLSVFHAQHTDSEENLAKEVEDVLSNLVTELLDESHKFLQTEDRKVCEYCNFSTVCNR